MIHRSPADLLRERLIRDAAARTYDGFAEDLARLGDDMAVVGADTLAQECREFAYIAWRASQAEHLDPQPEGLR